MPILTIIRGDETHTITLETGANLRRALLDNDFSPYTSLTRITNCGGRGLCATCGVWVESDQPTPTHWHDNLAARFGYPRLSCQITITEDMTVRILQDKVIWGSRAPHRAYKSKQDQSQ